MSATADCDDLSLGVPAPFPSAGTDVGHPTAEALVDALAARWGDVEKVVFTQSLALPAQLAHLPNTLAHKKQYPYAPGVPGWTTPVHQPRIDVHSRVPAH